MTNIRKRIVSMILALCMLFTMVPPISVEAADYRYYTVEKYDSEGTGTMLVNPTKTSNWNSNYGSPFITSILGDNVRMDGDIITGIKDDSQDDGWLDNGDLGDGSRWLVAADSECFQDTYWFYPSKITVIRFIYVPGNDLGKAGITSEGAGWGADGLIKVDKSDLVKVLSDYEQDKLGGNRRKAYDEGIAMILNTTDATAESVAAAVEKMQTASDLAESITLPEESIELYAGQKITLEPTLEPGGSTDTLTWKSSDESVVTVENGAIKAMSAGTATVTVTAENPEVSDSIEVTVNALQALYITNMGSTNVIMAETEELTLMADVEPSGLENLDWQWSVEDDTIAEVTPMEGNEYIAAVKGKKEGKTNVIVALGSLQSSFEVEVTPYEGPYVYFEYSDGRDPQLLDEDDTITLTCLDEGRFVVGNPNGTTVWSGGNDYVTSIQGGDNLQYWVFINRETGVWSPWDVRTLDISVDSGGWTKEFQVDCIASGITELKNYVGDQEVTLDDPYVTEGTVSGVAVTTKGKNADGDWISIPTQALNYDTSDTAYNFRWVGNQMNISSGGQATMSVFMKDDWSVKAQFIAKCTYIQLTGFTIETPETFTITGETDFMTGYYYGLQLYSDNLKITYTPSNATNKELSWEALTPDIAFFTTEHNSGIVPKKCGTAKFKVTSVDNPSLTQDVVVTFLYQYPLKAAELAKTEYEMKVGDTETLEITTTPENATEKGFAYSCDKEGIVEVKNGTIVAKSAGTVTVTGTPLDDTQGCNNITFTVTVTGEAEEQDDPTPVVKAGIENGLKYLEDKEAQEEPEYGDEWRIFTILRAGGSISEEHRAAYLDSVEASLQKGLGNAAQPTDYVRLVLALGVMGEDPEDFRGYNLIETLYNWKNLDYCTSNQMSWTLLALDSKNYDVPADAKNTRENLIAWLLTFQLDNGAFSLTDAADVDMTGMIIQALAPYNNDKYPEVQTAIVNAVKWLQGQMTIEAGFAENSQYNENSCSTAQVLTALSVAGIDAVDPANGFTVGKKNMITNLWSYRCEDGGFYWDPSQETKANEMGTYQVTYALESYRRFAAKENSLYDLTDVATNGKEEAKEITVNVPLNGTYTERVSKDFEPDPMPDGSIVSLEIKTTAVQDTQAKLGTDRFFNDNGTTSLSNCLYTLKTADEGFTVAGVTADGTEMYLNIRGGSATIPGSTESAVISFNDLGSGKFSVQQIGGASDIGAYLYFHQDYTSANYLNFNRNGSLSDPNTTFQLYRPVAENESSSAEIPGYVKVTGADELKDNVQILIVHKGDDGDYYVMHPSLSDNKYDHVARVGDAVEETVYEAVYTGVKEGTVTFTDKATGDVYTVNVIADEAQKAAAAFTEKVEKLPAADKLTLDDKETVEALRAEYEGLSDEAKAYVSESTLDTLKAAEEAIAKLEETPVDAGTITVAVERFAIGQGYLIEPYTTTFKKGDTYADICERILKENGFTYTLKGDAFYLSGIDHADSGKISIPECIQKLGPKKVGVNYVNPPDNTAVNEYAGDTAWLGEFSYSKMSGWMYSVGNDKGHEFPGVGMDGKTPEDGDVFRLQFTVWGYGEDLTGVEYNNPENVYYEVGDKTALTKEIAQINADKKNWISAVDGREEAYNNAMEVLQKLDATQAELDAALELLKNPVSAGLQILTQPEDYTGAIGETAVFKVEAEGEGLSYQWQYCKANSDTWKKVSGTGSKTAALSVKISKTKDGQKYRCVITDKKGTSVTSDAAVLKIGVSANAPKITGQPEDYTGTIGETAVFKVEAEGEGLSYQWQYCKANSSMWRNVSGAGSKTAALSVEITKAADGQKYRCVVTNKAKLSATSDAAVLKVEVSGEAPKITGQPEDYAGAVRETAVFKVEAEGEGLSYQWQYCKANSDTWKKVSGTGSKTASLSVKISKTKDGQKYRCVITDAAGRTVTSEAAVLTVNTQ